MTPSNVHALNPTVPLGSATLLLDYLGIEAPEDLEVEAIAQACGATVFYEELGGCEARLVGAGDRAIIAVEKRAARERQRFSVAHELGHWVHDRGKVAFACEQQQYDAEWGSPNPERRANRFAAELLLPRRMFKERCRRLPVTFASARALARTFTTSLTATAIRFVELGGAPALILGHERGRVTWSARSQLVPPQIVPHRAIPVGGAAPHVTAASEYVSHPPAWACDVTVDHAQLGSSFGLVLVWWHGNVPQMDE